MSKYLLWKKVIIFYYYYNAVWKFLTFNFFLFYHYLKLLVLPFGDNFCLKVLLIEGHEGYRYILYRSSARLLFAFGKMHYLAALRSVFHIFKVVTQKTTKHMIISFINSHD